MLVGACSNRGTSVEIPPTSGTATIDSRVVNLQASGFSFDQAAMVKILNSSNALPDIQLLVNMNQTGAVLGVYLARPDSLVPSFRLLRRFNTLDSARSCFDGLREIPDTTYQDLALPVNVAEIWAVKTRRNKFAKILITETVAYTDTSNPSAPAPFGQATFDWSYQPNGTGRFYTNANGR